MFLLKKIIIVSILLSINSIALAETDYPKIVNEFIEFWKNQGWLANFLTIMLPVITILFAIRKAYTSIQKKNKIVKPAKCVISGKMDKELALKKHIKHALDSMPNINYRSDFKGKCKGTFVIDFILDLDGYKSIAIVAYYGDFEYLEEEKIIAISRNIYNFSATDDYFKVVIITNSKINEKDKSTLQRKNKRVHFIENKCTEKEFINELLTTIKSNEVEYSKLEEQSLNLMGSLSDDNFTFLTNLAHRNLLDEYFPTSKEEEYVYNSLINNGVFSKTANSTFTPTTKGKILLEKMHNE